MSAAPATEPAGPSVLWSVSVETDDDALRAWALGVLGTAGIDTGAGADLIVVLLSGDATARLTRIQAVVELHAGAAVVAAMPAQCGGAALRRALHAGVGGIVLDDLIGTTLVPTVQAVLAGQLAVPPALRRQLAPPSLSFREKQILRLVVDGYTNRQIADELFVAESTVKTHLSSAFGKLDARSRAEAAAIILDPETGYGSAILGLPGAAGRTAA